MKRVTVILSFIGIVHGSPFYQYGTNTGLDTGTVAMASAGAGSSAQAGNQVAGAMAGSQAYSNPAGPGGPGYGAVASATAQATSGSNSAGGLGQGLTASNYWWGNQVLGAGGASALQEYYANQAAAHEYRNQAAVALVNSGYGSQATAGAQGHGSQATAGAQGHANQATAGAIGYGNQAATASAAAFGNQAVAGVHGYGVGGPNTGSIPGIHGFSSPSEADKERVALDAHGPSSQLAGPSSASFLHLDAHGYDSQAKWPLLGSLPHPNMQGFQAAHSFNSTSYSNSYAYKSGEPARVAGFHENAHESSSVTGPISSDQGFQPSLKNSTYHGNRFAYESLNTVGAPVKAAGSHAQGSPDSGTLVAGPHSNTQDPQKVNPIPDASSLGNSYAYDSAKPIQPAGPQTQVAPPGGLVPGPPPIAQDFKGVSPFENSTSYKDGYAYKSGGPVQAAGFHESANSFRNSASYGHRYAYNTAGVPEQATPTNTNGQGAYEIGSGGGAVSNPNVQGFQVGNSFKNSTSYRNSYSYNHPYNTPPQGAAPVPATGSLTPEVTGSHGASSGSNGLPNGLSAAAGGAHTSSGKESPPGAAPVPIPVSAVANEK